MSRLARTNYEQTQIARLGDGIECPFQIVEQRGIEVIRLTLSAVQHQHGNAVRQLVDPEVLGLK